MTKSDWLLFPFSFLIGILAGGFLYLTVFVPEFMENQDLDELLEDVGDGPEVTGRVYGSCSMLDECWSFRLSSNGEYEYFQTQTNESEPGTGHLSYKLRRELSETIAGVDLTQLSEPVDKNCSHLADGLDYTFYITHQDVRYLLDTCDSQLTANHELTQLFLEIYQHMLDV